MRLRNDVATVGAEEGAEEAFGLTAALSARVVSAAVVVAAVIEVPAGNVFPL